MIHVKHKHHIIPKHVGGTDDPNNLVELSVEEHAEAHRLLFEQYGRKEDELAWKGLAGLIGKEHIEEEVLKLRINKMKETKSKRTYKAWNKGLKGIQISPFKGKTRIYSDISLQKMRQPRKNKENMGKYERTPEIRLKISETVKNLNQKGVDNPSYENYILCIEHKIHGKFTGTRLEFLIKYPDSGMTLDYLRRLHKGFIKKAHGWINVN